MSSSNNFLAIDSSLFSVELLLNIIQISATDDIHFRCKQSRRKPNTLSCFQFVSCKYPDFYVSISKGLDRFRHFVLKSILDNSGAKKNNVSLKLSVNFLQVLFSCLNFFLCQLTFFEELFDFFLIENFHANQKCPVPLSS